MLNLTQYILLQMSPSFDPSEAEESYRLKNELSKNYLTVANQTNCVHIALHCRQDS